MLNTTLHRILLVAAIVTTALLADAWHSERRDSAQLVATLSSQKAAIQQAADREKLRDTQLAAAIATIASQKRNTQTPRQAASAIPSILPPLPLPMIIHMPELSAARAPANDLPATISIPQPDLKPLYDDLEDCRANALETAAAKKDLADEQLRAAALQHERDAARAAARGGTFWHRLRQEAKWFAIGIVAGAAVTAVVRH
jgi:hypothetical protein